MIILANAVYYRKNANNMPWPGAAKVSKYAGFSYLKVKEVGKKLYKKRETFTPSVTISSLKSLRAAKGKLTAEPRGQ